MRLVELKILITMSIWESKGTSTTRDNDSLPPPITLNIRYISYHLSLICWNNYSHLILTISPSI